MKKIIQTKNYVNMAEIMSGKMVIVERKKALTSVIFVIIIGHIESCVCILHNDSRPNSN